MAFNINDIQEGWIKMVWTDNLASGTYDSTVAIPEGNTFIKDILIIVTTFVAGNTINLGITANSTGLLDSVLLNAGMQSLYTDANRGAYAPNTGNNEKVYWHIDASITGSDRNLKLALSQNGTAAHILIKYVNIVA